MKSTWGLALLRTGILVSAMLPPPGLAAEYQGMNIDGRKLPATAYSHETGGTFDIEVGFEDNQATLYFVNGGQQTIQLHSPVITNPQQIEGWGRPFSLTFSIFSIGLDDRGQGNLEPFSPRPFEGFWRIRLDDSVLQSVTEWE